MLSKIEFMNNLNVLINLNPLGANVTVQSGGDGGSILRPGCRMIVLIPLQVLDCPERESARCTLGSPQQSFLYLDIIPLDWSDSSFRQSILTPPKGGKTETALWHLSVRSASLLSLPVGEKFAASALCFKDRIEPNLYGFKKLDARF